MKPVILVTADRRAPTGMHDSPRVRPRRPETYLLEAYTDAVRRAGGLPLVLPPGEDEATALLDRVDGVVLTGGHFDIHPSHYGGVVSARLDRVDEGRTSAELALALACLDRDLPILGICGGMQALVVAAGGTLIQDLPKPGPSDPEGIDHEQPHDPAKPAHVVQIHDPARRWLGESLPANSTHHQAVDHPGAGLVACGWAPDGVVEVVAGPGHRFALGVQWHPELLGQQEPYDALLQVIRG